MMAYVRTKQKCDCCGTVSSTVRPHLGDEFLGLSSANLCYQCPHPRAMEAIERNSYRSYERPQGNGTVRLSHIGIVGGLPKECTTQIRQIQDGRIVWESRSSGEFLVGEN